MNNLHRFWGIAGLAAALALVACGSPAEEEPATPTPAASYVGSWKQTVSDGWSKIIITEEPGGLGFNWSSETSEESVRCGEPGLCVAYHGEQPFFEYRFRTFRRDDSPHLFLECNGTPLTVGDSPIRYVDRLELSEDGQEMWAHTLEAEGFSPQPPVRLTRITGASF